MAKQLKDGLGFGSAEDVENDSNGGDENPSLVEVKKRKRGKKKPSSDSGAIDEDLETHLGIKKLKIDEGKTPNFGVGKIPDLGFDLKGKEHTLGFESEELLKQDVGMELNGAVSLELKRREKKRRERERKRKREDLETQSYGFVMNGEGLGGRVGEKRKKAGDPVEMMVSEEGFDDEAKLLRTVVVGNLPLKVKKKALFKEFSQFGEIESVRIRSITLKKTNDAVDSVHAYIVFKTEEAAQASVVHNTAVVGGNYIRVDRACPPHKKLKGETALLYDNERTVIVGNLPFDVQDDEIYQLFSGIEDLESSIEAIRVIRDSSTSEGKVIAYVLFKTRGAANLVVKNHSLKLWDHELRLSLSKSNLTPSKRKNPSPGEGDNSPTKKLAVGLRKRPAVAARKPNALKGGGASKQAGEKRKLERETPETSRPYKKSREFV